MDLKIWSHKSDRVFKFQKKAVRLINNSRNNAHTAPLFKYNKILKLRDMCALQETTGHGCTAGFQFLLQIA